jgi:phosphoglycolate phosphatase-like HAD superfamily hydrolase
VNQLKYAAYVFDMDGTLFTIPVDWRAARNTVSKIIGQPIEGKPLFPTLGKVTALHPEMRESLFATLDSFEMAAVPGSKPIEGAIELLGRLGLGSRVALVTMQGSLACSEILRMHGITGLFRAVFTREASLDRAVQLLAALRILEVSPREVLFVGDMQDDVLSARRAGVEIALVRRPPSNDAQPDHAFASLRELQTFLTALTGD